MLRGRKKIVKGKLQQMSERQMLLAEFCAGKELTKDCFADWNRRHSQHAYRKVAQFRRDAQRARQRLLFMSGLDPMGMLLGD